jgi:AcrR family transcriptional regulator
MSKRTASKHTRHAGLSRAEVLATALAIVREEGIDFSIRRLAAHLNVWPMAVYRHYANREDLVEALVDAVIGEALAGKAGKILARQTGSWQVRLENFALAVFDTFIAYPGVARKVLHGALHTPNGIRLIEASAAFLIGLGLPKARAGEVFQAVGFFITEMAMLDHARRIGESRREILLEKIEPQRSGHPVAVEMIRLFVEVDLRDRLKSGIRLIIRAVETDLRPKT